MQFSGDGFSFPLGEKTYIMGIVNVTPDSFSDGGRYLDPERAVAHALRLQQEGADLIDIGAQSTRPGFTPVPSAQEWERLRPVLEGLSGKLSVPVSVDTFYPDVAEKALKAGAHILNDITGGKEEAMFTIAARCQAGLILMHPGDAADTAQYAGSRDIGQAVHDFLLAAAEKALAAGVKPEQICLDPGIGFGKTMEQNRALLLSKAARVEGYAYLVGASRKRVTVDACPAPPDQRVGGTVAAHTLAQLAGADILRVHDVFEAAQAARLTDAVLRETGFSL